MKRVHVIGRKNHGKTQLVVDLVEEFARRGLRVGTMKHTHHHHELDTPGKDSQRHRTAGASVVGIVSPTMNALFLPVADGSELDEDKEERYTAFATWFDPCDLVIVEGDAHTRAPKIEAWRAVLGSPPLAASDRSILAVITDDPLQLDVPILSRRDVRGLADWMLDRVSRHSGPDRARPA
jgi:molybdopterin-guanine dinucleotide biosynthesis adapter protein